MLWETRQLWKTQQERVVGSSPPARTHSLVPAGAAFLCGVGRDARLAAALPLRTAWECAAGSLLRTLLPEVSVFSAEHSSLLGSSARTNVEGQREEWGGARREAGLELQAGTSGWNPQGWEAPEGQKTPSLSPGRPSDAPVSCEDGWVKPGNSVWAGAIGQGPSSLQLCALLCL